MPPRTRRERSLDATGSHDGYSDGTQNTNATEDLDEDIALSLELIAKVAETEGIARVESDGFGISLASTANLLLITVSDHCPFGSRSTIRRCHDRAFGNFFANAFKQPLCSLVALKLFESVSLVATAPLQICSPSRNPDFTEGLFVLQRVAISRQRKVSWGFERLRVC